MALLPSSPSTNSREPLATALHAVGGGVAVVVRSEGMSNSLIRLLFDVYHQKRAKSLFPQGSQSFAEVFFPP
jgi:hypothetical protein